MPSPFDPAPSAKRLRKLLRKHLITPHQYAVADALLWSCRAPGRDEAQISYDRLAELAGVGRSTAVEAVKALRRLGVLSWRKTRLRVAWSLGIASRQWRNIYRLLTGPCTEFAGQPTDSVQASKKDCIEAESAGRPEDRDAANRMLAVIRTRRMAALGLA
jgi:DNA-binding IclR family transcriptional regulator